VSYMTQPSPSDADAFLELVSSGESPYDAARAVRPWLTGSKFRSLAKRDPEFAARYEAAKQERERVRMAGVDERRRVKAS
jgi:hypothetical protein